ncbi:hypothetical protein [Vulgatibacter sp.]|uniref:hypothetical protein n=1 Tax=Vulgatibacter sp. TaxID=1971226 RepID=UPI0035647595
MAGKTYIRSFNELAVTAYKLVGFAALTAILVGLLSYFAINAFYLVSTGWLAPAIVSPTDERVLQLSAQFAQQNHARETLLAEKLGLEEELEDAKRTAELEEGFQQDFARSLESELNRARADLGRYTKLVRSYEQSSREIAGSAEAYQSLSRADLDRAYEAKVLPKDEYVENAYLLGQISRSNLGLGQTGADLVSRRNELQGQVSALESAKKAIDSGKPVAGVSSSQEVMMQQRHFLDSQRAAAAARGRIRAIERRIEATDRSLAQFDKILQTIQDSPYLKAIDEKTTIAFVPYENLGSVTPGSTIHGCSLAIVWCRRVGKVVRVLEGEVVVKHPLSNRLMRGLMVELDLREPRWAEEQVLHAGRAPLFL